MNSSLQFDALDDFTNEQYLISLPEEETTNNFQKSLSPESYTSFLTTDHQKTNNKHKNNIEISERPFQQIKTNTWKSIPINTSSSSSSSSHLISFANFTSQPTDSNTCCGDVVVNPVVVPKDEIMSYEYVSRAYSLDSYGSLDKSNTYSSEFGSLGTKRSSTTLMARTPSHAQDHVIAERKRRERITERFIALSAIVPDLKKLDKATVLGDAIKYLKHLQGRVKLLEEQIKKKSVETIVSLNRSKHSAYDDSSLYDENSGGCFNKTLPEIEAKVSEKNVLVRIQCKKQKGFIPKMLSEIEKLHLTVISSSVLPFGSCTMDITIVAQMDAEFCLTLNGLVRNLRTALQ